MNPALGTELRSIYVEEFARIQMSFAESGDGKAAVAARTKLVDSILRKLWTQSVSSGASAPQGVSLVALGGFGREGLYPYSDVDILFLFESGSVESSQRFRETSLTTI